MLPSSQKSSLGVCRHHTPRLPQALYGDVTDAPGEQLEHVAKTGSQLESNLTRAFWQVLPQSFSFLVLT